MMHLTALRGALVTALVFLAAAAARPHLADNDLVDAKAHGCGPFGDSRRTSSRAPDRNATVCGDDLTAELWSICNKRGIGPAWSPSTRKVEHSVALTCCFDGCSRRYLQSLCAPCDGNALPNEQSDTANSSQQTNHLRSAPAEAAESKPNERRPVPGHRRSRPIVLGERLNPNNAFEANAVPTFSPTNRKGKHKMTGLPANWSLWEKVDIQTHTSSSPILIDIDRHRPYA